MKVGTAFGTNISRYTRGLAPQRTTIRNSPLMAVWVLVDGGDRQI